MHLKSFVIESIANSHCAFNLGLSRKRWSPCVHKVVVVVVMVVGVLHGWSEISTLCEGGEDWGLGFEDQSNSGENIVQRFWQLEMEQ